MPKSTLALIAFLCVITNFAQASSACKGHFINPITDVCWNCLFPLTIGKSKIVNSDYPDTENPKLPVCSLRYRAMKGTVAPSAVKVRTDVKEGIDIPG